MVTIKDVAEKANVSISTVSYALNGVDKVSSKTRDRILKIAEELQYKKNGFASDLKRKRTNTIALILDDLSGPFYSELVKGVQDVVIDHGYDLVACNSIQGQQSTAFKYLSEQRADGCIIFAHNITEQMIQSTKNSPIILLDRKIQDQMVTSILVDNYEGGFKATEYLINKGHRKIAYVSGPQSSVDNQMRYKGYKDALQKHDIEEQTKWNVSGEFTKTGGTKATKLLMAQGELPTAIFFANDEMAIGGMSVIKGLDLQIPEDISVIGFDDILEAKYVQPNLTTIRQPKYEMGSLAAHLMFRRINGENIENVYHLKTELCIRESVFKRIV